MTITNLLLSLISKADSESMTVVALTSPNVQLSGLQEGHYVAYVVTVGQNSSTIVQSNPSGAVQFSVEPRELISYAHMLNCFSSFY